MAGYYELNFLQVHSAKSGDAIAVRYQIGNSRAVQLSDGSYTSTAPAVAPCIRSVYGTSVINNLVITDTSVSEKAA